MNRWASSHAAVLERDLDEGETLLAASRVVIVSATSVATWGDVHPPAGDPLGRAPSRSRGPRLARVARARKLGFPLPGSIFALGISDRRLLLWETSPLLAMNRRTRGWQVLPAQ